MTSVDAETAFGGVEGILDQLLRRLGPGAARGLQLACMRLGLHQKPLGPCPSAHLPDRVPVWRVASLGPGAAPGFARRGLPWQEVRSEEHTSDLQSLMRI